MSGRAKIFAEFVEALGSWPDGIERPKSRPIAKRKDPFA
jgi:hypothetical protein